MKRRLLALFLAVAMLFSICTVVSAGELDDAIVFAENFDDGESLLLNNNGDAPFEVVDDPAGTSKVLKVTGGDQPFTTNYFLQGVDANSEYTVAFRMLGDCGHLLLGNFTEFWQQFDPNPIGRVAHDFGWSVLRTEWNWYVVKVTGQSNYSFIGQVQGGGSVMSN